MGVGVGVCMGMRDPRSIIRLEDENLITFAEQALYIGRPAQFAEVDGGDQARLLTDFDATAEPRRRSHADFAV